jgi:hypothetical protein
MGQFSRFTVTIHLCSLRQMTEADRKDAPAKLVRDAKAPRNGQASGIDARIRAFEIQYEMTSDEAREKFRRGELKDTADVAQWMLHLSRG